MVPSVQYRLFLEMQYAQQGKCCISPQRAGLNKAPHTGRIQKGFLENFQRSTPWNVLLRNNEHILTIKDYDIF